MTKKASSKASATRSPQRVTIPSLESAALRPRAVEISAECMEDGEIMGVRHVKYPINGVQFHPESILCEDGKLIIKNFLEDRHL